MFDRFVALDEKEDLLFDDQYQDALNTWVRKMIPARVHLHVIGLI